MNRFLFYILGLVLTVSLSISGYAQEDWEEGAEIEDAQIVVEKNKKIELPTASRKFEKIDKLEKKELDTKQEYSGLKPTKLDLTQVSPRLQVLKIKSEKPKPLYGNYVEAGFGNYVTPMLNAYFNSTRNSDYAYGAYINHISSKNGPVDYSGMSDSKIGVYGDYFLKNATVKGALDYENDAFRYYGFNSDSVNVTDEKSIKQNLNAVNGKVGITGVANSLNYQVDGVFSVLGGKNNLSDVNYGYESAFIYELADKSSINVDSDLKLESAKNDTFEVNRTYFTLNPNYKFLHEGINITLGLNTAFDNDEINGGGKFHVYPHVFVNYPLLVNELNVFAGFTGGLERNSFSSLIRENQWFLMTENLVFNNDKKIDFFGGLKGNFEQKLGYKAQVSFKNYQNLHFFTNNTNDSTQFTVVTDTGNTSVLNLKGELNYNVSEKFDLSANLEFINYSLSNLKAAYHRPSMILGVNGAYIIQNKVRLTTQINYISGLKGNAVGSGKIVKLNDIIDLNFGLDYKLSDNFSTFVQLNNVSSSNYSYYLNYPNKRFNMLIGITYSF